MIRLCPRKKQLQCESILLDADDRVLCVEPPNSIANRFGEHLKNPTAIHFRII